MPKIKESNVTLCFIFQREAGRKKPVYVATTAISINKEGNAHTKLAAEKLRSQNKGDISAAKIKHICKQLRELSEKKAHISNVNIYINDTDLAYALNPDVPMLYRRDVVSDTNLLKLWDKTATTFDFINVVSLEDDNGDSGLEASSDVIANSLRAIAISYNADSPVKREKSGRLPRPSAQTF